MSTSPPLSIAVVIGSLRKQSFNRRLANALVRLPEAEGHSFSFAEIADLPLYNQDNDADPPAPAKRLKAEVRAADAVIFVTPEYNRSIPGVLKNAIDHVSRPFGDSGWPGKPAGVIGVSPGATGTAMSQQHLRNVLAAVDVRVMALPEAFLQYREDMFDESGQLTERSAGFVGKWLKAFLAHTERVIEAGATP